MLIANVETFFYLNLRTIHRWHDEDDKEEINNNGRIERRKTLEFYLKIKEYNDILDSNKEKSLVIIEREEHINKMEVLLNDSSLFNRIDKNSTLKKKIN